MARSLVGHLGTMAMLVVLSPARVPADGHGPMGLPAPVLGLEHWLNSAPLEVSDLKGKVVLVRWWTDACPYCEASAPALRRFDREFRDRGLVVIGVFHPKPAGDASVRRMKRAAEAFQFTFPIALDAQWTALERWWLDRRPRGSTSVSFLIDRAGVIRYVHPGGEFHEGAGESHLPDHARCNSDFREIQKTIVRLLAS